MSSKNYPFKPHIIDYETWPDLEEGLALAKRTCIDLIEQRTKQLNETFVFNGVVCSLSTDAQINLLGLCDLVLISLLLGQPWDQIGFPPADPSEPPIILATANDALAFYGAANSSKKAVLLAGAALEQQVAAAVDFAELYAIEDDRG